MPQFIKDNVDPKYLNFIESLKDEALNNLPSLIEDKINNPELSNILRAFSTLFNDSILNISIHTFANSYSQSAVLKKYSFLPNFLEVLFKMKLSDFSEPLLLSGPTCYKTYASKIQ